MADGATSPVPYSTTGSGGYAAMSIMESGYKDNMTRTEAIDLCVQSVKAGVLFDVGSGN
eukprot:CAMPEP_0201284982 /NCGR_PEP_ID=MMETSP1317-20130820/91170_1 /ASSEMBLY_ACC=CAM_ASM_000770 /TAXON_ID=187299 /ORGANISM="Undescribed Undescribed, Strain Undescribed" /LENGTH=58 /DNA_ID=CAMNT_0047607509 /DNA_START=156 /DNA_END=332 /DNA_ORIENTATION=+